MKKILFFLFAAVFLLSGCSKKEAFTLKGVIDGLSSDTIIVFYQEPHYKLDTIIASKGKFTYTITPDTFTIFSLLLDRQDPTPIFANKGEEVILNGTPGRIQIKGKGENERMASILEYLSHLNVPCKENINAVDSIIKSAPHSYTNIYLINKYYVQDTLPDYERIGQLIKSLSGIIKDTPYMIELQNKLERLSNASNQHTVSNLSCTDKYGKPINWSTVRNKYVLLDFWASWDSTSVSAQDSLATVQKALKKEKFTIISLSLDLDRKEWLAACSKRDSTQWKQVCDFKGWNSPLVLQQGITRLPANLLISPNKKIIAKDIRGKALTDKVKELIQQDKEKEKAAQEAEKARKKQNRR